MQVQSHFQYIYGTAVHRRRFWGARGQCPLVSDNEGGKICLAPSVFWQVIPTWQEEMRSRGLR